MSGDRTDDDVQTIEGQGITWVEIASVGVDDEARLLTGFLDAEGIPAQIENVKFTEAPTTFGSMGDIRIYVAAEDEQRALAMLKQRNDEFEALDVDGETVVTNEGSASIDDNAETEKDNG
jgi:hypothetical protein